MPGGSPVFDDPRVGSVSVEERTADINGAGG